MVEFLVKGFVPSLYAALGIYIPLIVVNCIILGRAESYASKNSPLPSLFDGIGMGLGFTCSITIIGAFREFIGAGQILGKQILPLADAASGKAGYVPITIFVLAPGAFLVLGSLTAIINAINNKKKAAGKPVIEAVGCGDGCATCASKSVCQTANATANKPAETVKPVEADKKDEE
jgi:electron transport complex protein RnfE